METGGNLLVTRRPVMASQTQGKVNNLSDAIEATRRKKKVQKQFVLDKKELPTDKNAYVFRNPQRNNVWTLYFYDRYSDKRHRFVLKDNYGNHIPPIPEAQDEAFVAGIVKFSNLKEKIDRGEKVNTITFKEMCDLFIRKEKTRISDIPHRGITSTRWRLVKSQVKWARDFLNNDKMPIHRVRRNAFDNYEVWRIEQARLYGKKDPIQKTIISELGTIRRMFEEVAVARGYLSRATMPEITIKKTSRKRVDNRRDDLTEQEWLQLERSARLYFIRGRTRILDDNYKMEKHDKGRNKGLWKYKTVVTRNTERGKNNITHRMMFYYAMRIAMDSGMRIGSIKKLKWRDIDKNTALPEELQKKWCSIDVPPENTKTGIGYRCAAPIMKHLNHLKNIVRRDLRRPNDFIFINQKTGKQWSSRIWEDYLKEVLVEGRLANWKEGMTRGKNGGLQIDILSGKNLTFYSFRHTHITWRLREGTPMAIVARNTNTSMQYIEKHYFHYKADESVAQLAKGREKYIKPTLSSTEWIRAFEVEDYG